MFLLKEFFISPVKVCYGFHSVMLWMWLCRVIAGVAARDLRVYEGFGRGVCSGGGREDRDLGGYWKVFACGVLGFVAP